ncbi:MAG TPA: N-acetylmuramoyl-L-alanine amidase [Acidimicrobiales bacterium]
MHPVRLAVAALFLASTLAAALIDRPATDEATPALTTTMVPETTTSTVAPPVTEPPPTTTTVVPVPTTAVARGPAKVVVSPTGVVLPVTGREGGAYRVATPCGKSAVVQQATPVDGVVVLDAGHGGVEPGAVGPNGLTERALNLAVTNHAKAALERAGIGVVLTRAGDYRMTIGARAAVVKAVAPKAFVSIHHNAEPDGPRPEGPGSETYYQTASADSKRLSGLLYEEIVKALSAYQVAWVADRDAGAKYRTNDRGDDYYGIIRTTKGTPSALAELAFISNPAEEALLARPDVQQVEGEAVARGIVRYLTTKDEGSGFTTPYPRNSPAGSGGGADNCLDPPL